MKSTLVKYMVCIELFCALFIVMHWTRKAYFDAVCRYTLRLYPPVSLIARR